MSPFSTALTSSALAPKVSTTALLSAAFYDWTVVSAMDEYRAMMWSMDGPCCSFAIAAASTEGIRSTGL
jgi:hypothetical protein